MLDENTDVKTPSTPTDLTQDGAPENPTQQQETDTPEDETVDLNAIADNLSQKTQEEIEVKKDVPVSEEPLPFDIQKLRPEQLQQLKQMLNATPDRVAQKKQNTIIELREINYKGEKRIVVDFKDSRLAIEYKAEQAKDIETHKIMVKFDGDDGWTDVLYDTFMGAKRVKVEVLSTRKKESSYSEGEILQRKTGKLVEMRVTTALYFFKVKLPNGKIIEIEGKLANA